MYRIETENFMLELSPTVHENDLTAPVNTEPGIKVQSYGFSAESELLVNVKMLNTFSIDLKQIYETLQGLAKMEEPYGAKCFVEFAATTGGHIKIKGIIDNKASYGYTQSLSFENEIDQTYLKDFSEKLFADYGRWSEENGNE